MEHTNTLSRFARKFNKEQFLAIHDEMSYGEYLDILMQNPLLARSAYQRIWDMIVSEGVDTYERYHESINHYKFFDRVIPIFGLDKYIDEIMRFIKGAAGYYGTEKRILLLHGPVGSSKSSILRRIKRGMEEYSRTPAGAWYSFKWVNLPTGKDGIYDHHECECPLHEDPLRLAPPEVRDPILAEINNVLLERTPEAERAKMYSIKCEGEADPFCRLILEQLLTIHKGDWEKVMSEHIRVIRRTYSEADRCGIATFQPKDEKNQDATELTGDINFRKIAQFGKDSDPRAFSFDGELEVGNRGLAEFIEILKLDQAFLYDLLGAAQEQQIKPKKFAQILVDMAIIGHCNLPDYEKVKNNIFMEAFKDRTVKLDVPHLVQKSQEQKIYERDFGSVRQHVAPHTWEIAALWGVLTRLEDDGSVDLIIKAKLYDGESLPNYSEDNVMELREKFPGEGMGKGVSPRYIQEKASRCLSDNHDYINVFMLIRAILDGLDDYPLITSKEDLAHYKACGEYVIKEYDEILKDEVRGVLVDDDEAAMRLCGNYIDHVMAYISKKKIRNKFTNKDESPDERLMRSIEEKINVTSSGIDAFRQMITGFLAGCHHRGETFSWKSNPELKKAIELKLFEDAKDSIKTALQSVGSSVVDPDVKKKVDDLKQRLIKQKGYNEKSAQDVLEHVAGIFTRGELALD